MAKIGPRKIKLSRYEQAIEAALERGDYVPVKDEEFRRIQAAIEAELAARRKDAVLNIRVNSIDLKCLKDKAKKIGVKYQSFISEILHRAAQS